MSARPKVSLTLISFWFDVFAKIADQNFENKVAKTRWVCSIASCFVCRGRQTASRGGCNVHLSAPKVSIKISIKDQKMCESRWPT